MAKSLKTPQNSHIRRRMSNLSPLRKSIPNTSTPIMQHIVNDDEAERARRRSCSELQRRVSNIGALNRSINTSSSVVPNSDSEQCTISEASLEDHYQTCVKLFTENKINTKNAWNLHIIEFMRAMLKRGLVMRETLKLASTSLDIGSKVYGLRVDDIHTDIFKLASAMARINVDLENNKENEDDNRESSDEDEAGKKKEKKEKQKRKRLNCDDENAEIMIAKDEKSLNGIVTPHNTQYTGAATSGKDKLYTISMLSKQDCGWEQLVNCRTNFKFWTPLETVKEVPSSEPVPVTFPTAEGVLCPSFMDFVIDQWSPDDDDIPLSTQQARAKTDEIVYDENGLPIPELDASIHETHENNFDNDGFAFDHHGDDIEEEVGARFGGARPPVAFITDMRPGDGPVSDKPLQYSYRAAPIMSERYTITGVWAGPSHWKIKCLQRRTSGQVTVQGVPHKARRPHRVGPQIINFDTRFDEDFDESFNPSRKKLTRTRNHLRSLDKFTLPEDMCITTDELCRLSLRSWLKQPIGGTEAMQLKTAASADLNISTVYQYDNPNDADYCSQTIQHQNDGDAAVDDDDDDNGADNDAPAFPDQEFGDDNMVDMPNIVQQTFVPYATHAKKMDMKKLKDAIWKSMALVHSGDESILENEGDLHKTKLDHVSFGDMYKILPAHMSNRMGEELSCPLAFVALLHLANEQTLKLEGQPDLLDLLISTDK